ncbi:uncharacterized protein ATNIH1004_002820 [Aspergillus tanneri]|uniref:Uncharacterized protein n=1 Tax=Aspergillus tanneri TaxID=1220188 RepID=A0A5M9MZP3_9EURO|nr:uncharacterized protein ATNIH1004_002820 [Aspergillus tanneri]KAA8650139.1 hypothetical protein ATNIH1004_002820 [Aspergillus tanneri]
MKAFYLQDYTFDNSFPEKHMSLGVGAFYAYLPSGVGAKGWAPESNNLPMWIDVDCSYETQKSKDEHAVQIYKRLQNWAQRLEDGDWEVGDDGVLGGPENFTEGDTKDHWHKYRITPQW